MKHCEGVVSKYLSNQLISRYLRPRYNYYQLLFYKIKSEICKHLHPKPKLFGFLAEWKEKIPVSLLLLRAQVKRKKGKKFSNLFHFKGIFFQRRKRVGVENSRRKNRNVTFCWILRSKEPLTGGREALQSLCPFY